MPPPLPPYSGVFAKLDNEVAGSVTLIAPVPLPPPSVFSKSSPIILRVRQEQPLPYFVAS